MAGRPIKRRTCAQPVVGRAMPENEIPPAMRVDIYSVPISYSIEPTILFISPSESAMMVLVLLGAAYPKPSM